MTVKVLKRVPKNARKKHFQYSEIATAYKSNRTSVIGGHKEYYTAKVLGYERFGNYNSRWTREYISFAIWKSQA